MGAKSKYITVLLLLAFGLLWCDASAAGEGVFPSENGDLSVDGPYVFYAGKKVVVKSIHVHNGQFEMVKEEYSSKSEVPVLQCVIDEKKAFSFELKDKIRPTPSEVPQPSRLLAISDIEGNFNAFAKTLIGNGVIDHHYNWTFGDGHLVLVGDFFDRGLNVTPCLWLIYSLEAQAAEQGGMVHFILGNHEEMNLSGDHRYVRTKYLKVAKKLGCDYGDLHAANTELGRWLRSRNMMVKIGETIFVHGGLSPQIASCNLSIEQINIIGRTHIGRPTDELMDKGGNVSMIFAKTGPLWYRGFFNKLTPNVVEKVLRRFNASQVVVGHTIVDDISSIQDGLVYAIDVKHSEKIKNAQYNAFMIEDGIFYKVNYKGQRKEIRAAKKSKDDGSGFAFKCIRETDHPGLQKFLNAGNDINGLYSNQQYPLLHYAIEHGNDKTIQILLDKGADPDLFFDGRSALMQCIKYKNIRAFQLLLDHSVDVNLTNHRLHTALFYVAKYGTPELARALLDAGADPEAVDQAGLNPFQFAVRNKNVPVARMLKKTMGK